MWTPAKLLKVWVVGMVLSTRLWGQNVWYRLYKHQGRFYYDPALQPAVTRLHTMPYEILQRAQAIANRSTGLCDAPGALWNRYGTLQSNDGQREAMCHWHQLSKDPTIVRDVEAVRAWMGPRLRQYGAYGPFKDSLWHGFVLKYNGLAAFGWHYDTEDIEDVRSIYCLKHTKTAGHLQWRDANGAVQTMPLAPGEGYVLRGSTTYHSVSASATPQDERVMFGMHWSQAESKEARSLCTLGIRLKTLLTHWS